MELNTFIMAFTFRFEILTKILIGIYLTFLVQTVFGQTVNNITISPANPTSADTIRIISDFSYHGNCSYGMVSLFSHMTDTTIHILPTYCGYGSTTLCNSIDTFVTGPYPAGNYVIDIEYHQGSVCPFSGFDATIAQFDTLLVVSGSAEIHSREEEIRSLQVYPNPSANSIRLKKNFHPGSSTEIRITNIFGEIVRSFRTIPDVLDISDLAPGVYRISSEGINTVGNTFIKN